MTEVIIWLTDMLFWVKVKRRQKSAIEWGLNSNSTEKKNIIKNNIKEKITPLIMKGKENNGIMREKNNISCNNCGKVRCVSIGYFDSCK